ncbi:MAG TPA: serine/threonine-protein kinase [Kofleriaceae bacterium]|nr:serine/threonine-protein kinase [Kofleriaceae bacterium]
MEPVTPSQTPRHAAGDAAGDARPGDTLAGDTLAGDTRPGDARPGDARPGGPEEEEPTDLLIRVDPSEISTTSLPLADEELLPPSTMLGEYRLEGLIGKGGMGFVYAAVHPVIGKRAAVKVLRRELCRDPRMVERFIDEARVVNQIGHPNIVDVFAFGRTTDGRSYFVMEWLKGESLRARVARSPLAVDEIRGIVKSLASALSAAHAQGVIHRDLKPDNVFLVAAPGQGTVVKLLDFGVAKLVSAPHRVEQTASDALIGTPQYLAPEQAKSPAIDARADIYAFGVLLFELLTGRPPFVAGSAMEVVAMHLMEAPPRPSAHAPVSPEIDRLVVAMLAKSPDARPPLEEIAAVFERTRWPERPSAALMRPPGAAAKPAKPAAAGAAAASGELRIGRARVRSLLLVLLAAGLVATLAVMFYVVRDDEPAAPATEAVPATTPATGAAPTPTPATPPAPVPAPAAPPSDATADRKPGSAAPAPAPDPGTQASGSSSRAQPPRPRPPAPRPPVAEAKPATRTVRLVVDAADFVAKIDGRRVGAQAELAPGTHRLRVCARGKRPYERDVEIKSSDLTLRVELEPLRDQDLQCRE